MVRARARFAKVSKGERLINKTFTKRPLFVIPAKAGIHNDLKILDSRFHGNDHLDY